MFRKYKQAPVKKKLPRIVRLDKIENLNSHHRDPSPSVASIDSQTVPTAVMVSDSVGYDAGKKTKGRKRFTMVDTLGLLLMVKVVAADVQERDGAKQLITKMN